MGSRVTQLDIKPSSSTYRPVNLRQVTSSLCASIFSSAKQVDSAM